MIPISQGLRVDNLEEENKEGTEQNKEPEVDLVDKEGHKEKLEVYTEPVEEKEIIKPKPEEKKEEPKRKISQVIFDVYDKQYKKLTAFTLILVILAVLYVGFLTVTTGSFIQKDVSLKGGVTITVTTEKQADVLALEKFLGSRFTKNDVSVRSMKEGGRQSGLIIVADIDGTNTAELDSFIGAIESGLGYTLSEDMYSTEIMGSSLGASFFRETIIAVIVAFILMSIVVVLYFREFIPSVAVILCCFSDIMETLAVVNLIGMKVSTGGIAAFLMLIGYSVDTDMLLTTRVLKRKEGTLMSRVLSSVNTGMMMTLVTCAALIFGIIFMKSTAVRQIMIIILIGLLFDILNTWIQNVGVLRYYLERKENKTRNG